MWTVLTTEPVQLGSLALPENLVIPDQARGLVVFEHGSDSGRQRPRNRWVAGVLQRAHTATLLIDLLTEEESCVCELVLDLAGLNLGLFGASTGSTAALGAAAVEPVRVAAVISRGGRYDLAFYSLEWGQAPTLLIVGGLDTEVLALNRQALRMLLAPKRLEVVPDASHLFEELGALCSVAVFAASWCERHMGNGRDT